MRPAERRDPDLGEQQPALAIGGELEQEEVEGAPQGALGVEDVQLGHERRTQVLDDLIDGGDQEILFGLEVVVDETRGNLGLLGDALHRSVGEAVLDDGGAQAVDDLSAPWRRETGPSHRLFG